MKKIRKTCIGIPMKILKTSTNEIDFFNGLAIFPTLKDNAIMKISGIDSIKSIITNPEILNILNWILSINVADTVSITIS